MFFKIFVAIFTGNNLCWSLFLIKTYSNFIKKKLQRSSFPVNSAKFLRTSFIEQLQWLLNSVPYSGHFWSRYTVLGAKKMSPKME